MDSDVILALSGIGPKVVENIHGKLNELAADMTDLEAADEEHIVVDETSADSDKSEAESLELVSADGEVISELYKLNTSDVVSLSDIPKELRYALLSMEDREFFDHNGIRFESIFRALIVDLLSLSRRQGASTITQQLARNMYAEIGFEKTITRKIKEFITANTEKQRELAFKNLEGTLSNYSLDL